ncbi:MAG: Gfo/Idh/MocA family oxidoreductase [Stappiaceae bacterium]
MPRYAVIGSGMMGQEHIRNINLLGKSVTAVADPNEAMRTGAAELAGNGCLAFADYKDLLSANVADCLLIASPNHTHFDVLNDTLSTNLPILVEKPLCTTLDHCKSVLSKAENRPAPTWVAMEYRYIPPVARLIERALSGDLGKLRMLSIREHRFPFLDKVGHWNRFAEQSGGTLVEKCCHFFDLMRLISQSEPVRVFASGGQDVNHLDMKIDGRVPDVIDNAYVVVEFENSMRAMLDLCMFAEGSYWQEQIVATGDKAEMAAHVPGPARFWPGHEERESEVIFSPREPKGPVVEMVDVDLNVLQAGDHHGSTYYQHQKFSQLVESGNGQPEVTLKDGFIAVAIGLAAEQSIREQRPVNIADVMT